MGSWYEYLEDRTLHIAYVYDDGSTYFPDGGRSSREDSFYDAMSQGRAWRLVRFDGQAVAQSLTSAFYGESEPTIECGDQRPRQDRREVEDS